MLLFHRTILGFSLLVFAGVAVSAEYDESALLFTRHIAPLFREKCLACHGEDVEYKYKFPRATQRESMTVPTMEFGKMSFLLNALWFDKNFMFGLFFNTQT